MSNFHAERTLALPLSCFVMVFCSRVNGPHAGTKYSPTQSGISSSSISCSFFFFYLYTNPSQSSITVVCVSPASRLMIKVWISPTSCVFVYPYGERMWNHILSTRLVLAHPRLICGFGVSDNPACPRSLTIAFFSAFCESVETERTPRPWHVQEMTPKAWPSGDHSYTYDYTAWLPTNSMQTECQLLTFLQDSSAFSMLTNLQVVAEWCKHNSSRSKASEQESK